MQGDHAATRNALKQLQGDELAKTQRFAGEQIFREGPRFGEMEHDVGAQAAWVKACKCCFERLFCCERVQRDGSHVGERKRGALELKAGAAGWLETKLRRERGVVKQYALARWNPHRDLSGGMVCGPCAQHGGAFERPKQRLADRCVHTLEGKATVPVDAVETDLKGGTLLALHTLDRIAPELRDVTESFHARPLHPGIFCFHPTRTMAVRCR